MTSVRIFIPALLLTLVVAFAVPCLALAHILPRPAFIAQGAETTISFDVPNERAPHATVGIVITAPRGFMVVSAEPTPGWKAAIAGQTVTWGGGRLTGGKMATFGVGLLTDSRPGSVTLNAVQRYDDGQSVTWKIPFSVVPGAEPASSSGSNRSAIAIGAAIAIVVVAGSLALLLWSRRRRTRSS